MTIVRRKCINDVYKVSVELKQTTKRVNHRNEVTCLAASCPTRCTASCATNRDGSGSMCALTETLQRGGQLKTSPFHRHSTCRNVCSARVLRSASKMTVSRSTLMLPPSPTQIRRREESVLCTQLSSRKRWSKSVAASRIRTI